MSGSYGSLVHVGRDILAKDIGHRGTAAPVVCPPRKHCALRALLHHPRVRGWCSSGAAAWGPRAVGGPVVRELTDRRGPATPAAPHAVRTLTHRSRRTGAAG